MGRWSEQFLSKRIGEAKYEEVLAFLRAHTQNTVEIWIETQERTSLHVMGTLMEVSHDPSSWGRATSFVVIASGQDADAWHLSDDLRERLGKTKGYPAAFLSVPRHGISRYQCIDDSGVGSVSLSAPVRSWCSCCGTMPSLLPTAVADRVQCGRLFPRMRTEVDRRED